MILTWRKLHQLDLFLIARPILTANQSPEEDIKSPVNDKYDDVVNNSIIANIVKFIF